MGEKGREERKQEQGREERKVQEKGREENLRVQGREENVQEKGMGERKIKIQVKGMGKRKVKVQEKRKVKICKHLLTTSFGALIYHWSKFWRNVLRKRSKTENIFYEIGYLDYGTI